MVGKSWTYYVSPPVCFDKDAATTRTASYDATKVDGSCLPVGEEYVLLQDTGNPGNQYDVEVVANEAYYEAVRDGARIEDTQDWTLHCQFSGRKAFTYTTPADYTWISSNEFVASVETDGDGTAHILFTGTGGEVTITLRVGNGSDERAYTLNAGTITTKEGMTPFLLIPSYSSNRTTLKETDPDILFTSNLTARNAAEGYGTTVFTAELLDSNREEVLWTGSFNSTSESPVTHITVPAAQLSNAGSYSVDICGNYLPNGNTKDTALTATAVLRVKEPAATVKLGELESYSVLDSAVPSSIPYTVTPETAAVEYTIQKSGAAVGARQTASGGTIPFSAGTLGGLKDVYTVTVYARNTDAAATDPWSVDSLRLTVYNKDGLDIIIRDVAAGEIGGTTGGAGTVADNTTVVMDNSGKVASYGITGNAYQLSFDDFTALRTDMSLQKLISANYGAGTWGALSDKMAWASDNSSLVSVSYQQGGVYSNIENYSYTSYAPATDFLLVGKGETGDTPVTITATHAATGMEASFQVTAKTLRDRLFLFQFYPQVQTDVVYTNGAGEKRTLKSNAGGELAVYEPEGITGAVMAISTDSEGETYTGTLYPEELMSGERDIGALQLYPCNNLGMRVVSNVDLTLLLFTVQPSRCEEQGNNRQNVENSREGIR